MQKKEDNNFLINLTGIIVVILILFSFYITYKKLIDLPNEKRGTFGDMFGSINALYSGLAFAGIIYTILLQRKELKYQRQELQQTRKEFEIQNETLKLQRFENTFFNLLTLHHQIVDSIDLDINKKKKVEDPLMADQYERITLRGRDVFKKNYESLKSHLPKDNDINDKYLEVYNTVQTDFGHYFRNLYRIIKLIDQTKFINEDNLENSETKNFDKKYEYTSIVRSQLSDYELLWLFYNCLSSNGVEKFKHLIEKYSILKNIPLDKLHTNVIYKEYETLK